MNTTMKEISINPRKFYSLGEIVRGRMIPGVTTIPIASRLVRSDGLRNKILNAITLKRGVNGIQYQVKGSNIIKYLVLKDEQKN